MITKLLKRAPYFIVILVTGCATVLPMKHEYKSQVNFSAPFNEVWKLSSNYLEENVSDIDIADKKSGFLKTKDFNVPYDGFQYQSKYADCGELGGLYVYHKIIGYYEIFISEPEATRTVLRIIPHYRASLWVGKKFKGWAPCQSRGYVEQLLIDDLRAKIKKSSSKKALAPKPKINLIPETELKKSIIKYENAIQDIEKLNNEISELKRERNREDNENNAEKAELSRQSIIKYENAIQEIEKLNNEISVLKKERNREDNENNAEKAELSSTESPPELTIKSDNDVTSQSMLHKVNEEHSLAAEPLSQGKDDNLLIYTIQTGSFLDIDRARAQFDFITDLLQAKDYGNLRIEKIGNYYVVRIGKYDNSSSTKEILQKLIHEIKSPLVMKAYIKESRIIKPQSIQSQ